MEATMNALPRLDFLMPRRSNIRFVEPPAGTYGDVLRRERMSRDWSQVELAERVTDILYPEGDGIFRQNLLSSYERGETQVPHPDYEAAIDAAFGFPRGTLMGRVKTPAMGRTGRRLAERAVLPNDIVIHDPLPTMRRIWEHLEAIAEAGNEEALLRLERYLLDLRTQGSVADDVRDEPPARDQQDTEPGTKETAG